MSERNEVKKAAERLRRLKAGEPMLIVYPFGDPNCQYRADRVTCSDAYVATVAADEPLTVEWAKSRCYFCGEDHDGFVEVLQIENYHFDDAHTCSSEVKLKTRGDFLQLCKLLNIALTPIGQEERK